MRGDNIPKYVHSVGGTRVKVDLPDFEQTTRNLGIDALGDVQEFATRTAKMRMDKFTPRRENVLIETAEIRQAEIEYVQVYARPMYFGIDVRTGRPWKYTGSPQRGAFWDVKMIAAEGDQWAREVQSFSDRRRTE